MGGRFGIFFIVGIAVFGLWWKHVPGASGRFDAMAIDADAGQIELDGVTYTAQFGEPVSHAGNVRVIYTVAHEIAPVITHEIVLTTGDYSDPEIVDVISHGPGRVRMESRTQPEGTFTMVHVIPGNAAVVAALDGLEEGSAAVIEGRPIVGRMTSSAGGSIGLNGQGHAMLLADAVHPR